MRSFAILFLQSPNLHEGFTNCVGYHCRNRTTAGCAFTDQSVSLLSLTLSGVVDLSIYVGTRKSGCLC